MKHLLKLMTVAALGAAVMASCGQKNDPVPEKPVVTEDMYTVSAVAETGEVTFKFNSESLSPIWTVTDPAGIKTTFNDREVVRTFKAKGDYTGSLIAYGAAGQSDPVSFTFTISYVELSEGEAAIVNALADKTLCASAYGWWGEGWEYFDDPVEEYTADDRITFSKDGTLVITQGETLRIYNDGVTGGEEYSFTGTAKWAVITEEDVVKVQFADGGFPLMLAGKGDVSVEDPLYHLGLNAKWNASVKDGVVRLDIWQDFNEQYFTVFLSPVK